MFKRLHEIFEDINNSLSAKRIAFFIILISLLIITFLVIFYPLANDIKEFASKTQDKFVDLLKWIGGFILGEHAPKLFGQKQPNGEQNVENS